MWVEWDEGKAESNRRKHGIDFEDAATVLNDDLAVTVRDEREPETRFVVIGSDILNRVLVVVLTWRGHRVRIISARRASRRERKTYQERR
ncbi:MAG TPA: BrnT family toxin [Chromatiales bacterium]|nr:BrnT family toxin [Chromatiales bacterium]